MKGELKMTNGLTELEARIVKYGDEDRHSIHELVNLLSERLTQKIAGADRSANNDCANKVFELLEVQNEWGNLLEAWSELKKVEYMVEDGLIELTENKINSNLTRIYELLGEIKEAYLLADPEKVLEEKFNFL